MFNLITKDLNKLTNPPKAKVLAGFFKTGKGEYGEGDIFLGITVPEQRKIAKKYQALAFIDLQKLLANKIHEYRLTALLILVEQYQKANEQDKGKIVRFYLKNSKNINNWDLVDLSAPKILGDYFFKKDKKILYKFAHSKNLWQKRIAIVATFDFIRQNNFENTLKIAEILLRDKHDLIHKAVGWMLREVGKRDLKILENFLQKNYRQMPRTMLRYAIERFEDGKRKTFLEL